MFTRVYLLGKSVVIIYDADGHTNDQVVSQALRFSDRLRELGVTRVCIAAPPLGTDGKVEVVHHPTFGPIERKGFDDHRALSGRLADLDVLIRETNGAKAYQAVAHLGRRDRVNSRALALERLPRYTDDKGQLTKNISMYADILGCSRPAVHDTLEDLQAIGAIRILEGSLSAHYKNEDDKGRPYGFDWDEKPKIQFVEAFRHKERKIKLSKWLGDDMTQTTTEQLLEYARETYRLLDERLPQPVVDARPLAPVVGLDQHENGITRPLKASPCTPRPTALHL